MSIYKIIPISEPNIGKKELKYVINCIKSGWISFKSEYVRGFEEKFSKYCGAKYGIATSSGMSALQLALSSIDIKKDDEVIIPTFSMIAVANALTYLGAKVVLVDSELDYCNIDPEVIRDNITHKTKAIIVVHTYGHPVDMDQILNIAKDYGLYVIEDCAEAHGAEYRGIKVGGIGDIGCFSFYANKIITTGEGGMVVTKNEEIAEKARMLNYHGFESDHFKSKSIGYSFRMTSLQAALGLAQLEKIEEHIKIKRKNAKLYNSLLKDLDGIILPKEAKWAKSIYWMYSVLIEKNFGNRDKLIRYLKRQKIETRPFFCPVHLQPIYLEQFKNENFPIAEEISKKGINLPSGLLLKKSDIEYITESIISF
jgi:perosamine synthetase